MPVLRASFSSSVIQSGDPYSIVTSRRIAVERSVPEHYPGLAVGDLKKINTGKETMSARGHKLTFTVRLI